MSRDVKVKAAWVGVLLTAGSLAVAAGMFAARAVATDRMAPVEQRVGRVETRVGVLENDQKRQDAITDRVEARMQSMDQKLDVLLQRTR